MKIMRSGPIVLFVLLSALVAGCGGGTTTTSGSAAGDVAEIVPASAPVLIALETDPDSDQWQQADELLSKFPGKARLLAEVRDGLADEGVDLDDELLPALGDETYVVVLDLENGGDNVVVLTKPRDAEQLTELLQEADDDTVTREIDGWTAISESEATLDRFAAAGEKLADEDWFGEAQERVEEDALVTFFANGAPIDAAMQKSLPADCDLSAQGTLRYAAGTMTADDDGFRMGFAAKSDGAKQGLDGESLLSEVPSGAYAYIGSPAFDTAGLGLSQQLRCALDSGGIPDVEDELGVSYDAILDLFAGGLGLYLRPAALIPEITLLLDPEDDAKSLETLDSIAAKLTPGFGGKVQRTTVAGTEVREVQVGPISILYGANDDHVAVTTARAGIVALAEGGPSLADDESFKDATEAAEMSDGDEVFAYLDLRRIVDLADDIAGFAEEDLPREVRDNLEPLESFLLWGDASDPNDVEVGAFLEIG